MARMGSALFFQMPNPQNVCSNQESVHYSPIGLKFLTRIRLGLSHLRDHKFKHSFQDTLNPICSCRNDKLKRQLIFSFPAPILMQSEILS